MSVSVCERVVSAGGQKSVEFPETVNKVINLHVLLSTEARSPAISPASSNKQTFLFGNDKEWTGILAFLRLRKVILYTSLIFIM